MNVLVINGSSDLYGASRILLQAIKALTPRKVFLVVPHEGLLTEYIQKNSDYAHVSAIIIPSNPVVYRKMGLLEGIRVVKKMIVFRNELNKVIRKNKINWAYVNTLSCVFALPVLKLLRLKVLLHVHEILENEKYFTRWINKLSVTWCNKLIAVSEPVRLNLLEVCTVRNKEKIVTVLNGISDVYKFSRKDINEKEFKIITLIGRIKPEKGIWFFLDTISLLPERIIKKCKFLIIGGVAPGGELFLNKLESDIKSHPAKDHIFYHPFISDVTGYLNKSDVIVVPSLMKDPFPTTILEGLSAGKPVIATNTGGAIQSVKDKETGFLIEPLDKEKFADYLQQLIESDSLRSNMGEQARKEYLEKFSLEIFDKNLIVQIEKFEMLLSN